MKAVRIGVVTLVLLVAATIGPVFNANDATHGDGTSATQSAAGPCYLINGIWVCDP